MESPGESTGCVLISGRLATVYLSESERSVCNHFSYLLIQLMYAIMMKKKTSEALWHWSQVLETKVVAAWLLYTMQKKRKRERYSQAMDRHRKRLITIGVKQWIKV